MHCMINEEKYEELYHKARIWLAANKNYSFIQNQLLKEGADPLSAAEIVQEVKLIYKAQKKQKGSIVVLSGSIILLAGLLLYFSGFFSETSFTYFIYSFTSAGAAVMLYGLFKMYI